VSHTYILNSPSRELLLTIILYASCVAHIVNLATQALITAHTKSKHYDPSKPDQDLVDNSSFDRDEVGLIRSITVKVFPPFLCSSSR
jgi:hypothetical protein